MEPDPTAAVLERVAVGDLVSEAGDVGAGEGVVPAAAEEAGSARAETVGVPVVAVVAETDRY